jgi:2-iminobutanoate/2-iminopropanoate deaminase
MNILKTTLAIALSTIVSACSIDIDSDHNDGYRRSIDRTAAAPEGGMTLPFSAAVRYGNTLYLSGAVGVDPITDKLVEGGITAETRQTLQNIDATLMKHGLDRTDVIKCTVFMADINDWQMMNDVYVTYFGDHLPARSAMGANGLALGARVEIECIAAYNNKNY